MTQMLKADTAVKVVIGPVVSVTDGFTPVTTLALGTADEAELLKHDAGSVTDISGNTFAAITSADGYYNLTLTAAQLDTEGMLTVLVNDDSLCLPVKAIFHVVAANVYDSLFAANGTDLLDVEVSVMKANTVTASAIASNAITSTEIADGAITAAKLATDAITADKIAANAITSSELADGAITAAKIATDAITNAKIAADAIGASEIAADAIGSSELATTAVNEIRDAILADSTAFNGADVAAILTDTADMQPKLGTPAGASISADIAALNDVSAAQVATEISDALATDTRSLLGAATAPPASPTIVEALMWVYKVARNKVTQTNTQWSCYDDGGTVVEQKATVTDSGTQFEKGEVIAGP